MLAVMLMVQQPMVVCAWTGEITLFSVVQSPAPLGKHVSMENVNACMQKIQSWDVMRFVFNEYLKIDIVRDGELKIVALFHFFSKIKKITLLGWIHCNPVCNHSVIWYIYYIYESKIPDNRKQVKTLYKQRKI